MTQAEAEQYGLGLRSAIADAMERSPDGANKVRALIGNPKRRAVLQLVFGGKANLDRFVSTLGERAGRL
jgi:menaquinone-dependent protoporphyrinogen IX oxidase